MSSPAPMSRRRLLRDGAAGTAALYLVSHWEVFDTAAHGAPLLPAMRRSTWTALVGTTIAAGTHALSVVEIADLPIAASIPPLQGHDGAFVVRLSGAAGLPAGSVAVTAPGGLAADLFVAPVGDRSAPQSYEILIDRTIRIAGVNEEGVPAVTTPPAARTAAVAGPPLVGGRRPVTPRVLSASLRRGSGERRATAVLSLGSTRDIVSVRVSLLSGRVALARASSQARTPHRLDLRMLSGSPLRRGRYRLVIRLTARDGSVTTVRRSVKLR